MASTKPTTGALLLASKAGFEAGCRPDWHDASCPYGVTDAELRKAWITGLNQARLVADERGQVPFQ